MDDKHLVNLSMTPKSRPQRESKECEVQNPKIPLNVYLPLGTIKVRLSLQTDIVTSSEPVEAEDFLPGIKASTSLCSALVGLWRAQWLRIFRLSISATVDETWRIYILPDDEARTVIDRNKNSLRKQLDEVLQNIDISPQNWHTSCPPERKPFNRWPDADLTSLYYLFNTLPSPDPDVELIRDRYSRWAAESLLEHNDDITGLRAKLYPYQRRSAAEMLKRETCPSMVLDPRIEKRVTPTGDAFFYNSRDRAFLRHSVHYDSVRGGVLAETMGLGKTVICIALILSTKGHRPSAPPQYANAATKVRPTVGSLVEMAAATLSKHPIPWSKSLDDIRMREGLDMTECRRIMESQEFFYEIPPAIIRSHRNSVFHAPPEKIILASTTLVVVPKNLVHQWKSELLKHVNDAALKLLVIEDKNKPVPSAEDMAGFDVVLFSRPRFEIENRKPEEFYESPLKKLHFLRMIIDEGHSLSSSNSNAAIVAERLVKAERRWIISGTPAKDLMGIEVDLAALTHSDDTTVRNRSLEQRRVFNVYQEESSGAIKALGVIASRFLKMQPWATSIDNIQSGTDVAKWEDYVYRHESLSSKTYSGFSSCLRRTLEGMVVKTRPEDVERDILLPPLMHKVVRLEPSFYDKLTANLFILLIQSNAVTSERQDIDYLFHRNSQHHLHRLIASLRQSAFNWTGLTESSVRSSLEITSKYLAKEGITCSDIDREMLVETMKVAQIALATPLWLSATRTSDIAIFTQSWPEDSRKAWAFEDCGDPMILGLAHSFEAQKFVNDRLHTEKPLEGFDANAAIVKKALADDGDNGKRVKDDHTLQNSPSEIDPSIEVEQEQANYLPAAEIATFSVHKKSPRKPVASSKGPKTSAVANLVNARKRRASAMHADVELSADSELGQTRITGTNSSKLSYLIDRIMALHSTEKLLIFYDANYIAYHIATVLDLFHIKFLIYSSDISNNQRGKYLVLFNEDSTQRVMLMDIKQAAHGLNVCAASRVFFCNPVCRPNIEAQAIKRAHRIGQTKPVYVETLVLRGTIEEAMHDRAARMTSHEHLQAKTIEDDLGVARIIQNAKILPIRDEEISGIGQMAKLETSQQIFGRAGRGKRAENSLEQEVFGDEETTQTSNSMRMTKKRRSQPTKKNVQAKDKNATGPSVGMHAAIDSTEDQGMPQASSSTPSSGRQPSLFGG